MTQMIPMEAFTATRSDYSLTLSAFPPLSKEAVIILSMPIIVAKQLSMVLRQQVKAWEEKYGIANIPPDSYKAMGVSPEDW